MGFKYLSPEVLKGFDSYKYSSVDTSPLSKYVTHPFWNLTVKLFPLWLAPNVMTFCGFLVLVVNYVLLAAYDYDFSAAERSLGGHVVVPCWVWICCGVGTFVAHTLDGCDGKQARRTRSSTPLGELFDHGLDSWTTMLLPSALYSVFGRGQLGASVYAFYWVVVFVMLSFILSHWEKYNTGILYLPWTYDLCQLSMALIFLAPSVFGFNWLREHLPIVNCTFATFGISLFAVCLVVLAFGASFINVYYSYRDETGNLLSCGECVRPMVPCLVWFALTTAWVYLSPSRILEAQPRLVYALTGTVFSNITCRLIVSQMSRTRCDGFNALMLPLLVLLPLVLTCPAVAQHEEKLLHIYTTITVIAHIHYGSNVVQQMAEKFNIYVFSLEKPTPVASKTE